MSSLLNAAVFTALPWTGASLIRSIFNVDNQLDHWFNATIVNPKFRPKSLAYAPVLTGLYCSMGYASYLVYRDGVGEARKLALGLYAGQLALNWSYFPIFFRFKKLDLSFIVLCSLGVTIAACGYQFYPINKTASYLMIPYFIWVVLGSIVDFNFWRLNKDRKSN